MTSRSELVIGNWKITGWRAEAIVIGAAIAAVFFWIGLGIWIGVRL